MPLKLVENEVMLAVAPMESDRSDNMVIASFVPALINGDIVVRKH